MDVTRKETPSLVKKPVFKPAPPPDLPDGRMACEAEAERELRDINTGFKQRAARDEQRRQEATDSEYWVCLCFASRAQKEEFLDKLGHDRARYGDKHIDGLHVAELMGIEIESPDPDFRPPRFDPKLTALT